MQKRAVKANRPRTGEAVARSRTAGKERPAGLPERNGAEVKTGGRQAEVKTGGQAEVKRGGRQAEVKTGG
jgi:hypothetical protein